MGWLPSDEALADHEGWAAYMAPDGRLSGSSTSDGFLVRRPGADAAAAKAWRAGRPPSEAEADDLIPWADLTVRGVTAPTGGSSGNEIAVTWVVGNQGLGLTNSGDWYDTVYLERTDGTGRIRLGSVNHLGFLAVGDTYSRTESFRLPDGISGDWRVVVEVPGELVPVGHDEQTIGVVKGGIARADDRQRCRDARGPHLI